ncbi:MAG: DUF421 domain-containing protein [Clostridia bacterium]|nr:DUF421 domain-containing protein [Clostridia bacterium]MBQ1965733.1 DUF421 domain-containing protein [Clostridia bacterium]MBQ5742895.1 DUF421 domain-containing protein [Clostridia bacterium]
MAVALIRTAILYGLTILALRCMGKRQIGELEPAELVITLLISDLATLCMQDLEMPLVYSVVPMVTLVVLEIVFSFLSLKIPLFGRILGGRYSVLIDDGKINQREMKKTQMSVGELMEELRQNGLMAVEDVKYCVLETDGKISVIPKKGATQKTLPLILISDGVPVKENLHRRGLDDGALAAILSKEGIAEAKSVFLLYEIAGRYTCIPRENAS